MGVSAGECGPVSQGDSLALLRLCHLVSPALPVGAYAYSQGLEYAVHAGWVSDEASTGVWLAGMARYSVGSLDLPILFRTYAAWRSDDVAALHAWNGQMLASRETDELRAEERHHGAALARVLAGLQVSEAGVWQSKQPAFCTMFALAATRWGITARDAACGYVWSWLENQVLAAIKLVPLGQSAGQRLLHHYAQQIPGIVEHALVAGDDAIGVSVVAPTLASALHETQYTRLFRS